MWCQPLCAAHRHRSFNSEFARFVICRCHNTTHSCANDNGFTFEFGVIAFGDLRVGGLLLLVASAFDMLDGAVARATGKTSAFGGFLDSTLDRYSESIVYVGVLWAVLDTDDAKTGAMLTLLAASGALLISYARARAEAANFNASVGLVARTERVVILALALAFGQPIWGLWVLAIATHVTALTRIVHVYRLSKATVKPA